MFVVMTHEHRHIRRSPDNITFAAIERLAADEGACLAFFEAARFPGGLICSACGAQEGQGDYFTRHRARPGLFTCGNCRRQFSITSGTAMHRTRLPLGQWLRAIWLLAASSKGVSTRKLSEMLGLGAVRMQMLRHQIVGDLESFISNRANDFKEIVFRSSLDDDLLHQFNTINSARAWFSRESVLMRSGKMKGEEIPQEIRKLARSIMREALSRHRRPRFHRMYLAFRSGLNRVAISAGM